MGFKRTSDLIAISFGLTESAIDTFTQEEIALQLDVLNNEIFVVLAVDLNVEQPDYPLTPGNQPAKTTGAISSTRQTGMVRLDTTNCIATAEDMIFDNGGTFSTGAGETYPAGLDYLSLISTNNFFIMVQGDRNTSTKDMQGRVWGYRARADASTYAALVQSEVLSA